jgi:hypothetical protein
VEELLRALAATGVAEWMRTARWSYAAINGGHVLGVALLVGAIVPYDLKLLGAWPSVEAATLRRVLTPVAAAGLALAACCGALLFLSAPADYAAQPVFLAKMAAVGIGAASALIFAAGGRIARAGRGTRRLAAAVSLACWLSALALGRLIAFVEG